jgi:hypothetical protein
MIVTIAQLKDFVERSSSSNLDEVKVEINDTMETRLVIVPSLPLRVRGQTRAKFLALPSYEAGE